MQTRPQNNTVYFIIGVLTLLLALFAYWSFTGRGPLRAPASPQEGISLHMDENGINGTINMNGR